MPTPWLGEVSELRYFGRGLVYVGHFLIAVFGLIALWPSTRCPVCEARRCRCYDNPR